MHLAGAFVQSPEPWISLDSTLLQWKTCNLRSQSQVCVSSIHLDLRQENIGFLVLFQAHRNQSYYFCDWDLGRRVANSRRQYIITITNGLIVYTYPQCPLSTRESIRSSPNKRDKVACKDSCCFLKGCDSAPDFLPDLCPHWPSRKTNEEEIRKPLRVVITIPASVTLCLNTQMCDADKRWACSLLAPPLLQALSAHLVRQQIDILEEITATRYRFWATWEVGMHTHRRELRWLLTGSFPAASTSRGSVATPWPALLQD